MSPCRERAYWGCCSQKGRQHMGKPTPGPTNNWSGGTPGNDTAVVPSPTALKTILYDAGAGYDTLDLRALTTGLSLQLSSTTQGNKLVTHSNLWADSPFHGGAYGWDQFSQVGTKTVDSIQNFEKVIGTSGNDYISS